MNGINTRTPTDQAWDELCAAADAKTPVQAKAKVVKVCGEHPYVKTLGAGPYKYVGFVHIDKAAGAQGRPYYDPAAVHANIKGGIGTCAHCGKGILNVYQVQIGNGDVYGVGSECILKITHQDTANLIAHVKKEKAFQTRKRKALKAQAEFAASVKVRREESLRDRPEDVAFLEAYTGNSSFIESLKRQFAQMGGLSWRQWSALEETRKRSEMAAALPARTYSLAAGETLIVSKFLAHKIGQQTGLTRPHFAIEVLAVSGESEKAYKIKAKLSAQRTSHCCVCGKELTNPASVAAGIGPICGGYYEVENLEQLAEKLRTVEAVVDMWIPKSQIKERFKPVA